MGFFDFLSSPKQDIPTLEAEQAKLRKKGLNQGFTEPSGVQDDERLRLAQHVNEESRDQSTQSLTGASQENARRNTVNARRMSEFDSAVTSANAVIARLPGSFESQGTSISRDHLSDTTRQQIVTIRKSIGSGKSTKSPLALAEDFEILAANKDFLPDERNALSGVAAMFRRADQARNVVAVNSELPPVQPGAQAAQEAQAKLALLERQEKAAYQKLETMGDLNPQKTGIQNSILEIAKEREQLGNLMKQGGVKGDPNAFGAPLSESGQSVGDVLPPQGSVITGYMSGLGIDRETLVDRLHKSMTAVGIPDHEWESNVDPQAALLRVTGAMDPEGRLAQTISGQFAKAKAEDAAASQEQPSKTMGDYEEIDATQKEIQGREASLRNIYRQLGQTQFMHTWPGVILYVLVGMITQNPAFAAKLLGGLGNREAIDEEIKGLQADLRRYETRLTHQRAEQRMTRQEAARRLQRKDDRDETWRHQVGMALMNHKLIIERNSKKSNPETGVMKKLQASYQRAVGMAAKYSGEMQNEFAPTDKRDAARRNFDFYMKKAAALDMQLEEMGGDVLEEEAVEE